MPPPEEDSEQILKAILRRRSTSLAQADAENAVVSKSSPVDWNMVFIWQCPTMLMSYAFAFFMIALTLHTIAPLIRQERWGTGIE